ncbi:MAG: glycosyltransferase [Bacteroidales bacterium]|nr:glycosyltransferase [Bacteroidales bacterium]
MKSSDFKIVIVLPKLTCGGTERTAAELANYIAGTGGDATLVLMYKKERFYDLHPNVAVIEPDIPRNKLGKYLYIFYLLSFLRSQFKKLKPNVIFALGYVAFTLFASLGLKTKVVMSLRSSPSRIRFPGNRILNKAYKISHRFLKSRVDGIIAQTSRAAEIYIRRYKCPVIVIPNFLREIREYGHERENLIINIGHCSFEKGQHYLIQSFSRINALGWKLVIVGDGPKKTELEQLAENLGIRDNVIFTGYQQDVDYHLSKSKIFAFSSVIEGYPNALIEAMANGLPAVSFNCEAGPSDIISEGTDGFLVEVGDTDNFTGRLQMLVDQPELRNRLGKNALKVKQKNDLGVIAPKYLEFFYKIAIY